MLIVPQIPTGACKKKKEARRKGESLFINFSSCLLYNSAQWLRSFTLIGGRSL
jgi:hypothetical protein